jgi:hypothetical protein
MSGSYRGNAESLDRVRVDLGSIITDIEDLPDVGEVVSILNSAYSHLGTAATELERRASRPVEAFHDVCGVSHLPGDCRGAKS